MTVAPYGTWTSPLSASDLSGQSYGFFDLQFDGGVLHWREHRPHEGGRYALMHFTSEGGVAETTPQPFSAATRVHEYGGRAILADGQSVIVSNGTDQQLYNVSTDGQFTQLTDTDGARFADFVKDSHRNRIISVQEDHRRDGEARNTICAIPLESGSNSNDQHILVDGADFFAYPSVSPDGSRIAWVSWDHPNLPWDNTSLWIGEIDDNGEIINRLRLNEGVNESILQPRWTDSRTLYFISDRTDWWNIHVWANGGISTVHRRDADFAFSLWSMGENHYDFLPSGEIFARYIENQHFSVGRINPKDGRLTPIALNDGEPGAFVVADQSVYIVVRSTSGHDVLERYDIETGDIETIRRIDSPLLSKQSISQPEPLSFPTTSEEIAYAYYYAPKNEQFSGPSDEKPPLIVRMHGGPTFYSLPYLNYEIQFWTTRGFAVLDVNYRGSYGFGRSYRRSLYGEWGVKDIDDAINGAVYLSEKGFVDRNRLLIRGSSAGGFAVIAALTFHDVFAGGANYFGVSDLEMLIRDTHKFESRYFDHLIGRYPEEKEKYRDRSPIHSIESLNSPLITFQGVDDKIVLPNQSELIFEALKESGIPTAYLPFEGEKHGFQKSETRKRALETELYFYGKILNFIPADNIEAVAIHNLNADGLSPHSQTEV